MAKKPLLKDQLFNQAKVKQIADEIQRVYPQFDKNSFAERIVERFPHLELKERIAWISENLHAFLPTDYREATSILLASLPPPNDNTKTDNDFGDFIYAPYAEFVARNGVTKKDLYFSLAALKEITMRFSVEDAIRRFINAFPKETMQELQKWSNDSHYHVRRLTSEGTRPKLPWSQKIIIAPEQAIPILDNLFSDKTRYVTRSVANHINDISKSDPKLAITTLQRWQKSGKQNPKEMDYLINHALRTLIKQGNKDAMKFLHFSTSPEVEISQFRINETPVVIGKSLEFEVTLTAKKDEQLLMDYVLYFQNKAGNRYNKKVFKLKRAGVAAGERMVICKRHLMAADMTTRKLYPGEHKIELQINGNKMAEQVFDLQAEVADK